MKRSAIQSSRCISPIVEGVVTNAKSIIKRNKLTYFRAKFITKEITDKETQSFEQIRTNIPKRPDRVVEDAKPIAVKGQSIRPFSAQINTKHKTMYHQKSLNISSTSKILLEHKNSSRGFESMRSLKSLKNNEKTPIGSSKCIPLKQISQHQITDNTIEKLRQRKMKAQQYEVKKQKFLDSMNRELEQYFYEQQKFISSMNRKQYTYHYDGSILQTRPNRSSLKKNRYFPPQVKTFTRQTETPQEKNMDIHVTYRRRDEKQNPTHREWLMEQHKNMSVLLCPKSQNTKYTMK